MNYTGVSACLQYLDIVVTNDFAKIIIGQEARRAQRGYLEGGNERPHVCMHSIKLI